VTLILTCTDITVVVPKVSVVSKFRTDLVCQRAVLCIASNLCTDFGDAGQVQLKYEAIPSKVAALVARCPLAQRRRVSTCAVVSPSLV
jgi:hypothetical protein